MSVAPPSKILFLPPVAAEHDAKQGFPSPGSPTKPSWQNWQRSPAVWPVQKQRPLDASHIPAETSACPLHCQEYHAIITKAGCDSDKTSEITQRYFVRGS